MNIFDKKKAALGEAGRFIKDSKILIVDDTEFSRAIMQEVFKNNGFKNIEVAVDGEDALTKTYEFFPDIVFLDLLMPKLDGFEYCRRLRKDSNFEKIPILVQSASTKAQHLADAFKAGATDFINKPINPDEVMSRAFIHLENQILLRDLRKYRKRVESELNSAKEMQVSILPSKEQILDIEDRYNVDMGECFRTSSEIGGDFWGVRGVSDNEFAVYSVDFSGHGVTSALNTFRFHTLLGEQEKIFHLPHVFVSEMNNRLADLLPVGQFATMFYAIVNVEDNIMHFISAGAPFPIILKNNGEVKVVEGSGTPLGVIKDSAYDVHEVPFYKGEVLLIYSDALTETENSSGEYITEEDLANFLKENSSLDSKSLIEKLMVQFEKHSNGRLDDDLTINIYKRN